MSKLYIIAGCNGAGKTTASYTVLPEILECREFVNADEIAKGLSPFNPSSVAIEAGRLMLKRIGELLSAGVSFSVETTLSKIGRAHVLENFFRIYMPCVDYWMLADNSCTPRVIVPAG